MDVQIALNRILNEPQFAVEKQKLLDRLKESQRQLEEGEYVEFDEEGLQLFFEELKQRARRAQ
jgi:hypothetical protein